MLTGYPNEIQKHALNALKEYQAQFNVLVAYFVCVINIRWYEKEKIKVIG